MPPKPTSPISLQSNDRRIMLVPYLKHHVPRYHEWMKDPFIQQQTASEPLTLDEELEMQQEWMRDPLKHTFIVLFQQSIGGRGGGGGEEEGAVETKNMAAVDSYAFPGAVMVGDVNIFFNDHDDPNHTAEIEVMIAEEAARGKRIGLTAVVLMLLYGINQFQINKYTAKIGLENKVSISLFKDKLGFSEVSKSEVFQEVTLEMAVNEDWIENVLMRFVPSYNQKKYPILE